MRIAGYITHPPYHVTVFEMNHRFSIKIEFAGLEQWYKIRPSENVTRIADIEFILNDTFWEGIDNIFSVMKANEQVILDNISSDEEENFQIL